MDRPGDGQGHRHLGGFGAAHLAGAQTAAARLRTFKRSRDPRFAAKLTDIVGLGACPRAGHRPDPGVDPPAHAVVLSIDEKSQIQALDRTQPGLPIKPGRCQTMTHGRATALFSVLICNLTLTDIGVQ